MLFFINESNFIIYDESLDLTTEIPFDTSNIKTFYIYKYENTFDICFLYFNDTIKIYNKDLSIIKFSYSYDSDLIDQISNFIVFNDMLIFWIENNLFIKKIIK